MPEVATRQHELKDSTDVLLYTSEYYKGLENPTVPLVFVRFPTNVVKEIKEISIPGPKDVKSDLILEQKEALLDFEFKQLVNGIGMFSISFWDKNWTQIEQKLVESKGRLFFRFGYPDYTRNPYLLSQWHSCFSTNYSVDFHLEGVIVHIKGFAEGYGLFGSKKYSIKTDNKSLIQIMHEFIDQINLEDTESEDPYELIIDPTTIDIEVPQEAGESYTRTKLGVELTEREFVNVLKTIAPFARNSKGESGYQVFIKRNMKTGKKEFHFHNATFDGYDRHLIDKKIPRFTMFKDALSPIVSFQPEWNAPYLYLHSLSGAWTPEISLINKNLSINQCSPDKQTELDGAVKEDKQTSKFETTDSSEEKVELNTLIRSGPAALSPDAGDAMMKNYISNLQMGAVQARLTIVGHPGFSVLENIYVLVYIPKGEKSSPDTVHWISGLFNIYEIFHRISANGYYTTFGLFTTGTATVQKTPVVSDRNDTDPFNIIPTTPTQYVKIDPIHKNPRTEYVTKNG